MSRLIVFSLAVACAACTEALGETAEVKLVDCPRCDRRMRIAPDGKSATVNLSRLVDDMPDEATKNRRIEEMTARALRYLEMGRKFPDNDMKCPRMGWSSWNTFGIQVSDALFLETARAMATNGLNAAGYRYVQLDDGFFYGRDANGNLRFHPEKFPRGLKPLVDDIHALGLKAGTYSDAGVDTCSSLFAAPGLIDEWGVGVGLYRHDEADCSLFFKELGFDFFKVDYCGGRKLKLDERERYTAIGRAVRATGRTDVRYNLCRWAFPGTWVAEVADDWRTTSDIRANWKTINQIIRENLYLSAYASPGHYNDLDMLEAGQRRGAVKTLFGKIGDVGLTEEEEIAHFGMWCMMSSPLMLGCDVRTIPEFTRRLVTNPYLLAMDQNNGLGLQGYVAQRDGDAYVLVKDADERFGTSRYVALYNGAEKPHEFCVKASAVDLGGSIDAFDLVDRSDIGAFKEQVFVTVPAHAARFFRFDAEERLERIRYEAETAFLTDYQELKDPKKAGTAFPDQFPGASGGVSVRYLGGRASNDLIWKDVYIAKGGRRTLELWYFSPDERGLTVEVDGVKVAERKIAVTGKRFESLSIDVEMGEGVHAIRLSNASGWVPDMDVMFIRMPVPVVTPRKRSDR